MSQNLENFAKLQKFQLDNLVEFEKCCKTHIYLQKSVPIQPKTSNILPKFCQKLPTTQRVPTWGITRSEYAARRPRWSGLRPGRATRANRAPAPIFGKFSAKCCSFSAVSAPIFASKYAFFSIFQNLPDYPAENFEIWQNFAKFCKICDICKIFA